jgi:glutamyl-tRNA synthetase
MLHHCGQPVAHLPVAGSGAEPRCGMMRAMRGRFAPSPTGRLHLGNLRTALVAWLCARSAGSQLLLRIDDLDPDRSRPEHERRQLDDLARLGCDFDGEPVRQGRRLARYHEALDLLAARDASYPCFCTRAEVLAAASAPHGPGVEAPYPGTCARLSRAAARGRVAAGDAHCLRIRAGGDRIGFDDTLLGRVEVDVDDFIVRRRDGVPAYNLASPLDESDLAIEEVVRGADLAPTTPRQLLVAHLLDLHVPVFTHVPLVVGADGERLAKRHGASDLDALAAHGLDERGVLQLLARSLGDAVDAAAPTISSPGDLLAGFDRSQLPREPWRLEADP